MAIITRVYAWNGQYYLDWRKLPLEGLKSLLYELRTMQAQQGINFQEEYLIRDVAKAIKALQQ
jgi:hypothetical protein